MQAVRRWQAETHETVYDEGTGRGALRHLYLRKGFATGQVMVCLVANAASLRGEERLCELLREAVPGLCSVLLNENTQRTNVVLGRKVRTLWGSPLLEDELCGLRFSLSPHSFYQVNRAQAERLYRQAAAYAGLTGGETLLDLYCGAGTISLSMAAQAKRLIGVEIVEDAVKNARENAARNGVTNAEFLCADAARAAETLRQRGEKPDVVILDPPRKGCGRGARADGMHHVTAPRRLCLLRSRHTRPRSHFLLRPRLSSAGSHPGRPLPPNRACGDGGLAFQDSEIARKVRVESSLEDMDMSGFQQGATYEQIKAYVLEKHGLKVSSLYIAQVKQKCGIIERENYNNPKSENSRQPKCPPEKEAAITEALKFFRMI